MVRIGRLHEDFTPRFTIPATAYTAGYRSVFGPFFPVADLDMPGKGAGEYRVMVARMNAVRGDIPGSKWHTLPIGRPPYTIWLARNQPKGIRNLRVPLHFFKSHLERNISRSHFEESFPTWLFQPHAKRRLRVSTEALNLDRGRDDYEDHLDVEFKFKPGELLAPGKARGIGDLGAVRCNATAHICDCIKEAWSVPFVWNNFTFRYVKSPEKGVLSEVFRTLWEPGTNFFVYFSDDCCAGVDCSDGRFVFNGDIKACDGSHRWSMISKLEGMLRRTDGCANSHSEVLSRAFSYLKRPLVVKNRSPGLSSKSRKAQQVKYEYRDPRLYSGSVLTVIINNFANLLIGLEMQRLCPEPSRVTRAEYAALYVSAAENVGYGVKVQECTVPEDMQFLKHSPSVVEGVYHPWMNLGTWFRGLGTFRGDLPGRGTFRQRAAAYISDVVVSRRNWGDHCIRDAMQHMVVHHRVKFSGSVYHESLRTKSFGDHGVRIPAASLARRYRVSMDLLCDFCEVVSRAGVGQVVAHPMVGILHARDYA